MTRPRIAVHKFASCDGCQLAFLNAGEALLTLVERADIVHFAEAGWHAPEEKVDVAFVEGSISTPDDLERIRAVRESAQVLVTIGACAAAGGLQALRNGLDSAAHWVADVYAHPEYIHSLRDSLPISSCVKVDLELWGCPVTTEQVVAALGDLLKGLVPQNPGDPVCMECKRRGHACVMTAMSQPCMGPVTRTGCGALCPSLGRGCYGCFGPSVLPNTAALARQFEAMGLAPEEIARRFLFITPAAPAFSQTGKHYRDKPHD
jgi:sulfhydrogenase subunit delta